MNQHRQLGKLGETGKVRRVRNWSNRTDHTCYKIMPGLSGELLESLKGKLKIVEDMLRMRTHPETGDLT